MKKKSIKTLVILFPVILGSCGSNNEFKANRSFDNYQTGGRITSTTSGCSSYTIIKPPVDFLFLWDNSGSGYYINPQTKAALANTLNLISNNFDYHVVMAPLLGEYGNAKSQTQVNNNAFLFVANPGDITSNMDRFPQQEVLNKIIPQQEALNKQFPSAGSTLEAGLERAHSLLKKNTSNGVFRKNAYHILVMISNGDDTSHYLGSRYSNPGWVRRYKNIILPKFKRLRDITLKSDMMRMISLVPHSQCKIGWKKNSIYKWMSGELYSESDSTDQGSRSPDSYDSYDLCHANYLHIFDGLNAAIHPVQLKHVYNYWLITKKTNFRFASDPDGIEVYKYDKNGKSTRLTKNNWCNTVLPSGYCYDGKKTNINTRQYILKVDENGHEVPKANSEGEPVTGHVIKLFGSDRVTYPECIRIKTKTPIDYYKFIPLKAIPYKGSIIVKINGKEIREYQENTEHGWKLVMDLTGNPKYFQGKNIKQSGSLPALLKDGYMLEVFGNAIYSNNDEVKVTYYPTTAYH